MEIHISSSFGLSLSQSFLPFKQEFLIIFNGHWSKTEILLFGNFEELLCFQRFAYDKPILIITDEHVHSPQPVKSKKKLQLNSLNNLSTLSMKKHFIEAF